MEQRSKDAAEEGAQVLLRREECALDMGLKLNTNYAAVKDAQIKPRTEEYASNMEQMSKDAAAKDAHIKPSRKECALSMGQSTNDAAVMDAQIKLGTEEYAGDTEHIAAPMMRLQPLHHFWGQNLTRLLQHLLLVSEIQHQLQ
jgi:hypothetical protein